jgi:opacity protein-like surface antigen
MGPGFVLAQKQKIKVTTEGATIRVKPDAASEVMAAPEVGTVYEVEAKIEDWFEIKITTDLGVTVTGYIHSMYVETEEPAAPEAKPAEPEEAKEVKEAEPEPVQPAPTAVPKTLKQGERPIQLSLRLGGLYAPMAGYDYEFTATYYDEPMTVTESVAKAGGAGPNFELGIRFLKFIEITAGFSSTSKEMAGKYGFSLPNRYMYNDIAYDDAEESPTRKVTVLDFGINFHPVRKGFLRPYFGLGGSSVTAKLDILKDMTYRETFYSDDTHKIEIIKVDLVNKSVNKFGFHVRGGLDLRLFGNLFLSVEGKYLMGKVDVPHPLTSTLTGHENEKINLDLGGFSGIFGIKVII